MINNLNISKGSVSILIPVYNRVHVIEKCILSALSQTHAPNEIIISDNDSSDGTYEFIVNRFKAEIGSGWIVLYKQDVNIGMVGNWNFLLTKARYAYVKYICSDDYIHRDYLLKTVSIANAHPTVNVVMTGELYIYEGDRQRLVNKQSKPGLTKGLKIVRLSLLSRNNIANPTGALMRRQPIAQNKIIFPFNNQISPDYDFYIKLLCLGDYYYLNEPLSCFNTVGGTVTNQNRLKTEWVRQNIRTRHGSISRMYSCGYLSRFSVELSKIALSIYSELCLESQRINNSNEYHQSLRFTSRTHYNCKLVQILLQTFNKNFFFRKRFKQLTKT